MKKLLKITLLLMIGLIPTLINAKEKEVKYKWYKEVKENIRYVSDAENVCEYFEEDNFMTSEWYYTINKPKEEKYRISEEIDLNFKLYKDYTKFIIFREFPLNGLNLYELELLDENNNPVDYIIETERINEYSTEVINDKDLMTGVMVPTYYNINIKLDKVMDISKMTFKFHHDRNDKFKEIHMTALTSEINDSLVVGVFADSEETSATSCNEDKCITEIKIDPKTYSHDSANIYTKGYRYKDKYFKCYDLAVSYAPGYHEDLSNEGYIKDDKDFIEIDKDDTIVKDDTINKEEIKVPSNPSNSNNNLSSSIPEIFYSNPPVQETVDKEETITEKITNEIDIPKPNLKEIAMVTKETKNNKIPTHIIFITTFFILAFIFSIPLIIHNVKKCRTK